MKLTLAALSFGLMTLIMMSVLGVLVVAPRNAVTKRIANMARKVRSQSTGQKPSEAEPGTEPGSAASRGLPALPRSLSSAAHAQSVKLTPSRPAHPARHGEKKSLPSAEQTGWNPADSQRQPAEHPGAARVPDSGSTPTMLRDGQDMKAKATKARAVAAPEKEHHSASLRAWILNLLMT